MDDILFFMEDQNGDFYVDTLEGMVVSGDNAETEAEDETEEERYISIPQWEPQNGFRLMEHFTATLRSPLAREELSGALEKGRGVFRAFKDALARYPETEKLWFRYKDREMKREVNDWYNALRESWGLERIGAEPEETESLIFEDFRFRPGAASDREDAEKLHLLCVEAAPDPAVAGVFESLSPWAFPGDLCMAAESSGGEFAGFISAVQSGGALHIRTLEVAPQYRGLGLGEALLQRFMAEAESLGRKQFIIDLPKNAENFSRVLLRESFSPCAERYRRSLLPHCADGKNMAL